MLNRKDIIAKQNRDINRIFNRKKKFHRDQAKLPIEEKIKILVELQKIVLNTRKEKNNNQKEQVWIL